MKNVIRNGRPLREMPYASARVAENGNNCELYSYFTKVAEVKDGRLYCYGLHSTTTRKHLGAFGKEFDPAIPYHIFRHIYEYGYKYNINTGEIEKV